MGKTRSRTAYGPLVHRLCLQHNIDGVGIARLKCRRNNPPNKGVHGLSVSRAQLGVKIEIRIRSGHNLLVANSHELVGVVPKQAILLRPEIRLVAIRIHHGAFRKPSFSMEHGL